jgi:hypothetical protein
MMILTITTKYINVAELKGKVQAPTTTRLDFANGWKVPD